MAKEPAKHIPKYQKMYRDLLLVLHKFGGSASRQAVVKELAKIFKLSDQALEEVSKTGGPVFSTRVSNTKLDLLWAGYVEDLSWGVWALSQKGKAIIPKLNSEDPKELNNFKEEVARLVSAELKKRAGKKKKKESLVERFVTKMETVEEVERMGEDIAEVIEKFIKEAITKEKGAQQLETIRNIDPFAFERLCMRLFEAMGYKDVDVTKKTKDGGIDGLGFLTFGLVRFKVVFQAKRWKEGNKINQDQVNLLKVAMDDVNAEKAVFITTSDFTRDAERRASDLGIECVNGNRLMELLQQYELGYSKKEEVITTYQFNKDFFKEV